MQHRPELDRWIVEAVGGDVDSVLDVGCGVGRNGFLLWEEGLGARAVGVDLDRDYCERARSLGVYDHVHRADLNEGLVGFADDSFDVVLCTSVLAMLDKAAGERLVAECERVARKRVVIATRINDLGPTQKPNPLENHRSVWKVEDLTSRGYSVRGFGSRFSKNMPGGRRRFLYGWYLGTTLAQVAPRLADEIVAVRASQDAS